MERISPSMAAVYHRSDRKFWRGLRGWQVGAGALVGLCLALGYQFQTTGLARTTPSKSAFITGLVVVLVPLLSAVPRLRAPGGLTPRWNAYAGAVVAFVGILLLTAPASGSAEKTSSAMRFAAGLLPDWSTINVGDVLTFGCAIGFAFHCIALSHVSPRIGYRPLAVMQVGFCAVFMALSLPLIERPHMDWTPRLMIALGISAVLATAAAFSIQTWAQSVLPPTHTALIMTMEPVFAWITSFLVMGERLGGRQAGGAFLILAGIAVTEMRGTVVEMPGV